MIERVPESTDQGLLEATVGSSALKALGRDEFLNLLVAQLKYQDPLNPQDGTEFATQLAQFSSLEQLINLNEGLGRIVHAQQQTGETMALSYLGKEVTAEGNMLGIEGGTADSITYDLSGEAQQVAVDIFDDSGRLVRSLDLTDQGAGLQRVPFDGLDANGSPLPDGQYSFSVSAADAQGASLLATPLIEGVVTGIAQRNGAPVLRVGNAEVGLDAIQAVRQAEGTRP